MFALFFSLFQSLIKTFTTLFLYAVCCVQENIIMKCHRGSGEDLQFNTIFFNYFIRDQTLVLEAAVTRRMLNQTVKTAAYNSQTSPNFSKLPQIFQQQKLEAQETSPTIISPSQTLITSDSWRLRSDLKVSPFVSLGLRQQHSKERINGINFCSSILNKSLRRVFGRMHIYSKLGFLSF